MNDDTGVVALVDGLRADLDELKGRQLVGYASLLTYKTASSSSYDISATLSAGQSVNYNVTLTHSKADEGALLVLNAYYRINNSAVMASPVAKDTQTNDVTWMKIQSNPTTTVWRLRIFNETITTAYTAYVKLFLDGTDTGTVIVAAA